MARLYYFILPLMSFITDSVNCLPHPQCSYIDGELRCADSDLDIPTNFDVSQLPADVQDVAIACPNYESKRYCSILRNNSEPLPPRSALNKIRLDGFRSVDPGQRPPFELFLGNVKHQITELEIHFSRIGFLDVDLFRGFRSLVVLDLSHNDIQTIAANTFQSVTFPLTPAHNAPVVPRLHTVQMSRNALQGLDWSVFQPIQDSLVRVSVSNQNPKLRTIHRSGPAFSLSLDLLDLQANSLSVVPNEILRTISPLSAAFTFLFQRNNFCVKPDCSCCQMEEFLNWVTTVRKSDEHSGNAVYFTCGGRAFNDRANLTLDLYRKCPAKTVPIPKRVCYEAAPIEMHCSGRGLLTTTEPDLDKTDSTSAVFFIENTFYCRTMLHEIHAKIIGIAEQSHTAQAIPKTITAKCSDGNLVVDVRDVEEANATKVVFATDMTTRCRTKFTDFMTFIHTQKFPSDAITALRQRTSEMTRIPLRQWFREFLICPHTPPLTVTCTKTATTASERDVKQSKATSFHFASDNSLRCRLLAKSIHEGLLNQNTAIIEAAGAKALYKDAVVAVCQKGRLVISDGNPELSVFKDIEYYSAPNKLCRDTFQAFLTYLADVVRV